MGPVLFGRCLNVMGFFPSLFAEIRGFKVQSYTPEKELPDYSQVIVGKRAVFQDWAKPSRYAATEHQALEGFTSFRNTGG